MEFCKGMIWKENGRTKWHYDDNFILYLQEKAQEPFSIEKLSKEIKMDRKALERIIKENNIKLKPTSNNTKFKALYQDYDWCYQKFLIEGLNHYEMANEANCSKRVVEKWCCEKHRLTQKFRQENKKLNSLQEDLIIGSLLGDGHIDKRETQPMFIVSHAENQKDYLFWKYDILKDLCNKEPSYIKESSHNFGKNKQYKCKPQYRVCTRLHNCLIQYRDMNNIELLNKLNELSLTIWVIDDGHREKSNWGLCVAEYTDQDIECITKILKDRFGLIIYSCKDRRYMQLNAESSRKLDEIIIRNLPNELDVVKYKILDNEKIANPLKRIYIKYKNKDILLKDFCNLYKINYKLAWSYYNKGIKDGSKLLLKMGGEVC